jgi:tRNA threonylcarbamoyl adenosine modification protein (Sua5/YciO/YrdC/YwlC family)
MAVRIVSVTPAAPRSDRLERAVEALARGAVVAAPTETFYALAADSTDAEALRRVNVLKGKPHDAPLMLLAADIAQVQEFAGDLPSAFDVLAATFWPGPLTLVVPGSDRLPAAVTGGLGTVAIRVPGLALPRRIAEMLGRPITGVSANRTGAPPCRHAADVLATFGDGIDLLLDGGPTSGGAPSTIVDLASSSPRIVRSGTIPPQALEPFLPDLSVRS